MNFGSGKITEFYKKHLFSFDVSLWEFLWPLMVGATLVVARPEGHRDSRYLVNLIHKEQITTIHFVPSMLSAFLSEPYATKCTSIKRVICRGEVLSLDLQERFLRSFNPELFNLMDQQKHQSMLQHGNVKKVIFTVLFQLDIQSLILKHLY